MELVIVLQIYFGGMLAVLLLLYTEEDDQGYFVSFIAATWPLSLPFVIWYMLLGCAFASAFIILNLLLSLIPKRRKHKD